MIRIARAETTYVREPLRQPFGFKGGYVSELWQAVTRLEGEDGTEAVGLGTQSVLWSDPAVFAAHPEAAGNALMYAVTEEAARRVRGRSAETPPALLQALFPEVYAFAREHTGRAALRETFALNALVSLDNAVWSLHAQSAGGESGDRFLDAVPAPFRAPLTHRHTHVAAVPTLSYDATRGAVEALARGGAFVVKIKLGGPGDPDAMLAGDVERLALIHDVLAGVETPHTADGRVAYYLDPNGRYPDADTFRRFLDAARRMGAFDRILIVEEPFPEDLDVDVSDLGVRVAADESAQTEETTRRRLGQGYGAVALKPIAKTLSMTLKIARLAHGEGVPCFCADLTVNPILVDWNKALAAHLAPLPGLRTGLLETNGAQNYRDWDAMAARHPRAGAPWTTMRDGLFTLGDAFYECAGGIFDVPEFYRNAATS